MASSLPPSSRGAWQPEQRFSSTAAPGACSLQVRGAQHTRPRKRKRERALLFTKLRVTFLTSMHTLRNHKRDKRAAHLRILHIHRGLCQIKPFCVQEGSSVQFFLLD